MPLPEFEFIDSQVKTTTFVSDDYILPSNMKLDTYNGVNEREKEREDNNK